MLVTMSTESTEAMALDTHRFVKTLMAAGFSEQQAEALANAQVSQLNANLATKKDIAEINDRIAKLDARVAKLEKETAAIHERMATKEGVAASLAQHKADMTKLIPTCFLAQTAAILAALISLLALT